MKMSVRSIIVLSLLLAAALGAVGCSRPGGVRSNADTPPPVAPAEGEPEVPLAPSQIVIQEQALFQPPLSPEAPPPFLHKVRWQGETLGAIARWYTGAQANWRRLAEANPEIDPHLIRIGDIIVIPEKLLVTRRAMPAQFLSSISAGKRPDQTQPTPVVPRQSAVDLFGPIEKRSTPTEPTDAATGLPLQTLDSPE